MKKVFSIIFILLVLLLFTVFIFSPPKTKALAPVDQASSGDILKPEYINPTARAGQTFKPSKNRLDAVRLTLSGNGSNTTATVYISEYGRGVSVGSVSRSIGANVGDYTFEFADDLVVTPDRDYLLYVSTSSGDAYALFYTNNAYSRGEGLVEYHFQSDSDLKFTTYGYDAASEVPSPGVAPEEMQPSDTDTGTSPTDTGSPSTSIDQNASVNTNLSSNQNSSAETAIAKLADGDKTAKQPRDYLIFGAILAASIAGLALLIILILRLKRKSKDNKN